jgi:RNA polymerase sigma factor (sigma-70 family)
MKEPSPSGTRASLLGRLRQNPEDASAWNEFVGRYGPSIENWCRRWHLQEADVQDVTQTVLVRLAVKMRSFVYDPERSFRAWLKTLTRHALLDLAETRQRAEQGSGDSRVLDVLQSAQARDDLDSRLAEAFDLELLELATARVRERVTPETWEAFQLTTVGGLSGAEAAARLNMRVASVFKAKSNVLKKLQEEIGRLEAPNRDEQLPP